MSNKRTVSVVIPFYGDPTPTIPLIHQLTSQVPGPPLEIIVADDSSPTPFPEDLPVQIRRRPTNGGFGSAVNFGAASASGDLLLILNSDLEIAPTFIQDLVSSAEPWQPCVASPALDEPTRPNAVARRWPKIRHHIAAWLVPLARLHETRRLRGLQGHAQTPDGLNPAVTDWVVGAAILIPREEFHAVGGFDERFFMNSEEVDLQRRLCRLGVRSVYLPRVSARHAAGGSTGGHRRLWLTEGWFHYEHSWGHPWALKIGLYLASGVNLLWNGVRKLRGTRVHPWHVLTEELSIINEAWRRAKTRRANVTQ